jgi:hypothetical protein
MTEWYQKMKERSDVKILDVSAFMKSLQEKALMTFKESFEMFVDFGASFRNSQN